MEASRSFNMFNGYGGERAHYLAHDWRLTSVGHPDRWPVLLRNSVSLMLDSRFPMFILWGPELIFLYNEPYAPLLGPRHPALGCPLKEVWPTLWRDVQPLVQRALSGLPTFAEDVTRIVWRDGHEQPCQFTVSYSAIRDDNGDVPGVLCVVSETTARVHLERRQALQLELIDRFRDESSPAAIGGVACELLGNYLDVPCVFCAEVDESAASFKVASEWSRGTAPRMVGLSGCLDDFSADTLSLMRTGRAIVINDVNTDEITAGYAAAYAAIRVGSFLTLPLVRNGQVKATLNVHDSVARRWTQEELKLAADIAERTWNAIDRLHAEASRRESAARNETLLRIGDFQLNVADALRHLTRPEQMFKTSCDLLGRFLHVSRVVCANYDIETDTVTCHANYTDGTVVDLADSYAAATFGHDTLKTLETGGTWVSGNIAADPRCPPDIVTAVEALGILSAVVVPFNRRGSLIACLFITDNKPRVWTQEEVRVVEDAAERVWTAVERVRAEAALVDADRRKDEFLAMLAHELRNPLAPISAAAQLMKMGPSDPDRLTRTSDIISRQVEHMTALVDDLLDVSRVTRGLVVLNREDFDIKPAIADAVEQVRPLIEARCHALAVHTSPASAFVRGDYKRLVQVLANLLNNAAKYTPEGGNLSVSMSTTEDQVVLSVSDNGNGITAQLLPTIFELFSQAERTSDRAQGGLGLGLALVKRLVELHGGTVSANSEGRNAGSEFVVRLPRVLQDPSEATQCMPSASIQPSVGGIGTATSWRLLVVEDNADAAHTLAMFLEAAGHQVAVARDPESALQQMQNASFDACLLDIGLPGMDGNELARRLRTMPQSKNAMLIAISGYGQVFDREMSRAAGFDHYFVKPVDPMKLLAVLIPSPL